jgi:O-acetyl-ADP-ribose deacetylase (regulator of RNase III)
MRLHFVDTDGDVVAALQEAFDGAPGVTFAVADILTVAQNALVSPANSYGFMDGGIDAAYSSFFGERIQTMVQEAINQREGACLPVGASLAVRIGHPTIRYLIVAPTMQRPEEVPAANCYRAMRAVLRLAGDDEELGRDIYCPGLATGTGRVPPAEAAAEMFRAFDSWSRRLT